jgi:hypothetical protein
MQFVYLKRERGRQMEERKLDWNIKEREECIGSHCRK